MPRSFVAVAVLAALWPSAAHAQAGGQGAGQPPRPIFGGGPSSVGQSLVASLSLGYGTFRTERRLVGAEQETREDAQLTQLSGTVAYGLEGARAGASATFGTSGQYYSELSSKIVQAYNGSAGAWLKVSNRTRLEATHSVNFQPAFQNAFQQLLDPNPLVVPLASDVSASDDRWLSHDTRVALSHAVSRRGSFTVDYGRRAVDFETVDEQQVQHYAGARYTHQLTASLGARVGYRYALGAPQADSGDRAALHTIDAGLDFSKAFSLSRRTTLAVNTGSAVVQNDDETSVFLTGLGTLAHRLGGTWSATLSAGRDVNFMNGLDEPVLSDRAVAGVGGNLGRRVRAQAAVTALRGEVLDEARDTFLVYTGSASVSVAVTRRLSWMVNYAYQESDFGQVDFRFPQQLQAFHAASTGVSLAVWRYLSLNVNYSYASVIRGDNADDAPKFRRQSVVVSLGTTLPLYASARK